MHIVNVVNAIEHIEITVRSAKYHFFSSLELVTA